MWKIGIFLAALILAFPQAVFAHGPGQPPFFKVNGTYASYYPVPTSSVVDFILPQDIAPESYLVGQSIEFEIDTNALGFPQEVVDRSDFLWDFGDGTQGSGLKNSHTYTKAGSYILTIYISEDSQVEGQLLQSMLINILPNENYKLPKAVITVDGWQSSDPLTDILKSDFDKEFTFDATKSEASGRIVEYFWDFGDGISATGPIVTHKYTTDPYAVFPLLRIKDENGFISDAFLQISDESYFENTSSNDNRRREPIPAWLPNVLIIGFSGLAVVGVGSYLIYKKNNNLKNKKPN